MAILDNDEVALVFNLDTGLATVEHGPIIHDDIARLDVALKTLQREADRLNAVSPILMAAHRSPPMRLARHEASSLYLPVEDEDAG